jgi:SAM-dependent methyltransferase
MQNTTDDALRARHLRITEPSPWVRRFAPLIAAGGTVLDMACGGGRHARHLLALGHPVVAVDKDIEPLADLRDHPGTEIVKSDLEDGGRWPFRGRTFAGIVVVNYLYRPLVADLLDSVAPGGVLIYETFARGNEVFSRPRNPDHLLKSGELLDLVHGRMQVIAYEHGIVEKGPIPGVIQRICAVNDLKASRREDGEPDPHKVHPYTPSS